mgnify:CR=1 FL=1
MDFWLKVFFVNWFINIILVEWALYKLKRIIDVDEVRDTQYKAFRRDDVKWFNINQTNLVDAFTYLHKYPTFENLSGKYSVFIAI